MRPLRQERRDPLLTATTERLAHDLGVADSVVFTGHRSDVDRLMGAADIYAMPSVAEPFGLVYLKAMAMNLPVVALDSGGAPEVVDQGTTGLLSAPGDLNGLESSLLNLLGLPETRTSMGARGRERMEAHFTTRRMATDSRVRVPVVDVMITPDELEGRT